MNDDAPNTTITACANCGKGEESTGELKACTACHMVKYCNRECQIAHRPLHKKACRKRAAELHDEALFKEPPPPEDCPICFLPLPHDGQITFKSCCGKLICNGCIDAMDAEAHERGKIDLCAFCRERKPTSVEEDIRRTKKLMDRNNAHAFYSLGGYYDRGIMGIPQDFAKAHELLLKAGELGCPEAYYNLGIAYDTEDGVEVDEKKAKHFYELAAINGDVKARHNLGCAEAEAGNIARAYKHFILSARAGFTPSLDAVKIGFMDGIGIVTKDEYANTLRAYQKVQDEMESDMRDKAAALG